MHGDDHGAYDTDVLITGAGRQGWSWHCSAARDYRVAGRARRFSALTERRLKVARSASDIESAS